MTLIVRLSVGRLACPYDNFLKGREVTLPCSYRSTCYLTNSLLHSVSPQPKSHKKSLFDPIWSPNHIHSLEWFTSASRFDHLLPLLLLLLSLLGDAGPSVAPEIKQVLQTAKNAKIIGKVTSL